jgi:hypothetical protein
MPQLSPDAFERLAQLTPAQAASVLLTNAKGVARVAEKDAWDTWGAIVGGEPGRRPKDGESAESDFCMAMVKCIVEGTEEPAVARQDPHQRLAA